MDLSGPWAVLLARDRVWHKETLEKDGAPAGFGSKGMKALLGAQWEGSFMLIVSFVVSSSAVL